MNKLRLAMSLGLLTLPFAIQQVGLATLACPQEVETSIPCPDSYPTCPVNGACQDKGSVPQNGMWGTDDSPKGARTRTAPSGSTSICHITYDCTGTAGNCNPNTSVQGQNNSKSTLTHVGCGG